jgi:hypothetical protein
LRVSFRIILIRLALFLILVVPGGVSADSDKSQSSISIGEYWRLVETTSNQLNDLQKVPQDVAHSQLGIIADQWEAIRAVQMPDGVIVPIDNSYLIFILRDASADPAQLSGLFAALLAEKDAWPSGKFTATDLNALESILAQPEYQWPMTQPSPLQKWWDNLVNRLLESLSRLLGTQAVGVILNILKYALFGLGAMAIILVVVYALRGARGSLVTEAEVDEDGDSDRNLTADSAFQKAQELSSSGDYRQAVRYLYLSSLFLLEERRLLRYDRSRTNREYLRSVAHMPGLSDLLGVVVEVFDRVWYGYQSLDEAEFNHYQEAVTDLRQQK